MRHWTIFLNYLLILPSCSPPPAASFGVTRGWMQVLFGPRPCRHQDTSPCKFFARSIARLGGPNSKLTASHSREFQVVVLGAGEYLAFTPRPLALPLEAFGSFFSFLPQLSRTNSKINGTDIFPLFFPPSPGGVGKSCLTGKWTPPACTHLDMGIFKAPGLAKLSTQHEQMSCER